MLHIRAQKVLLLIHARVALLIHPVRRIFVVVIRHPLAKMVRELKSPRIGGCVFEINYNEFFMRVLGEEKRG